MLALAAPPLHDHSSSHNAPVTTGKTPIVRSKLIARRAPSSASLNSTGLVSSTAPLSSSSASTSSSSTAVPHNSRSSLVISHIRSEPSLSAKRGASPPKSSQPKLVDLEAQQRPAQSTIPSMPASSPAKDDVISDIQSYPTPELLRVLAALLTSIATANDGHPSRSNQTASRSSSNVDHPPVWESLFTASRTALSTTSSSLTFHARNIPSISLQAYLLRILRYCPTTNEVFLSLIVYFDRMSKLAQEATGHRLVIDSYNVHRLVIAGVTVASKFFSDVFYTNSRYARVGGLPQAELNQLEQQFLLLNDFRLSISPEEMKDYWQQLMDFSEILEKAEGQAAAAAAQEIAAASGVSVSASRPLHSMGAYDAFGGPVVGDNSGGNQTRTQQRNTTPKRYRSADVQIVERRSTTVDEQEERDQESSVCSETETETDAETDDEPTIRPAHSCASSDTQSLFSNDASEDGVDREDYGGKDTGSTRDEPHSRPPHHHRWNSTASSVHSSTDGDRLMTSP